VRYAFIQAENAFASVAWMCERLGVSTSGFYAWRKRAPSTRAQKDEQLKVRIKGSFEESRKTYGSPRVLEGLREDGEKVGRNRVIRVMQEEGLRARGQAVQEHDEQQPQPTGGSEPARPAVRSGGTEPALGRRHDRDSDDEWGQVLPRRDHRPVLAVLRRVGAERGQRQAPHDARPRGCDSSTVSGGWPAPPQRSGVDIREDYQDLLAAHGIECSMSRRGNCLDNAAMESWFSTVKFELGETFESVHRGKEQLFDFIEVFYNQRRRHSALDYVSPARYERERVTEVQMAA